MTLKNTCAEVTNIYQNLYLIIFWFKQTHTHTCVRGQIQTIERTRPHGLRVWMLEVRLKFRYANRLQKVIQMFGSVCPCIELNPLAEDRVLMTKM